MILSFFKSRPALKIMLAVALAANWLHAAPYGPDGMEIEWTQPDGTKLSLRVFGDEFHGRTETLDGYTVVFDPATKSYQYASVSGDGQELVAMGMAPGKANPNAVGLAKHLDIQPAARKAKALARFREWDEATENSRRWSELKAQRQAYDDAVKQAESEDGPMPAPPSFTTIGDKKGLTLLIDFSDDPATIPQANVAEYCNGDNYTGYGNNGSVKKYYQDNSNNLLTYTNTITAYIRMAQPKSYYNVLAANNNGTQGRLLINDAIDILKALPNYNSEILPTFDTLTVDGSNRVVACNVFFAGGNSGVWAQGLWPHSWSLSSAKELSAGGKKVYKYQITNLGTSLTLGTFCHENGHMLCGYPDIYDYDYDSKGGAGGFCLMNSGGHGTNPVLINAYLKRASGWTTTTELTSSSNLLGTLVSTVGHADYNKIYRYANPVAPTTEYFLFENRQKTGRDANIAASGIAIWHIDQLGDHNDQRLTANTAHDNYECSLIQADNLWQFQSNTNSGDSKDLYYLGNTATAYTNTFSDNSSPDAKWWNGAVSGLNVYNISASGATMTLQFGLPPNTIAISAPNGGEQIYFSSTQDIRWNSNTSGNVQIELYKAGIPHTVLSASEANDGSYSWLVSPGLPAGNDYTIKISSVANPAYMDSSNAAFSILTQPTLADSLDATGLTWTNSGNAGWFAQSATSHDGIDAAQSGIIGHSQNSYMETTVTGPGDLAFWWKVSSESNYDFLRFYLDGTEQTGSLAKISGLVDWTSKTVAIPVGTHTIKWGYTKDGSVVANSDAAWVDQVVYTPSAAPEIAVEQPVDTNLADGSASIDCGVFNLSNSSSPTTFTVKNTGAANLTGLVLSKDGSHNADFTLGALGASTLAPGGSTYFTVTFSPSAVGTRNAAIHLASNDSDENPFDIALTGTGVTEGTLVVTPAGNLTTSGSFGGPFSPTSLQFTLSNPGTTPLEWTAAKTAAWVDLNATNGTLAPGDSTTVTGIINSNADTLAVGGYNDTVIFTNITNGNGNTTRGLALTINPIPAIVTLSNISQTYDSFQKSVSVTTNPPGLDCLVTYDGSANPPTNAGTYAVVATITTPNYSGGDSKDFVITKAAQTISFAALDPITDDQAPFALTATATSGLAVSFGSSNPLVATVSGDTVTLAGLGTTTITASQAGNINYAAATPVPQTLTVVRANPLAVTGGPYKVLIGQLLSLDGSASQPSHPETITSYEWDLNNDNTFGDATGATPTAINFDTLTDTWGMVAGLNTIQLKVTDSASKTSTVSTTVELVLSLTWDANGTTAGQTNGAGAWLGGNLWWDGTTNQTWAAGSNATFGGPNTAGGIVTLASPTSVNAITFNAFTGTYTLGSAGNAITLNNGITKNTGSGVVNFAGPLVLGTAQTWTNNSTSTISVSGSHTLTNAGFDLIIAGSGDTGFAASTGNQLLISGNGGITKSGSGRLYLGSQASPAHTYSGTTTLNAGITMMSNNNVGPGNLTMNGGVIESYWNNNFIRGLGAGNGQVQIIGGTSGFGLNGNTGASVILGNSAGNEAVWGAANEAGNTNATGFFNPSTLVLQTQYSQGTSSLNFQNKIDLNGTNRTVQVSGGVAGTATATISGIIRTNSGTAGIIKTGNGQLTLSAANTYNGTTTISAGPIAISNASALGTTAGITTIAANGSVNGAHLKISNNISSAENITITGTTEANSYVAAISNTSGTNTLSGNITLSSPTGGVRLGAAAGSLTFSGSISQTTTSRFLTFIAANSSSIIVNNAVANNGGALQIYNTTQTTGTGTVTLKGVSGSALGATSVWQTGILKLGVTDALNTFANLTLGAVTTTAGHDIGTFDLAGYNQTVSALIGSKNTSNIAADSTRKVTNSAAGTGTSVLTVGNGDGSGTFNGVIVDGSTAKVALIKSGDGTQTLAGPNSYTGATTITGGTLTLGASDTFPNTTAVSIGTATLAVGTGFTDSTGTLDVTGTATIDLGSGAALAFADSSAIDWTGGTLNLTGTFVPGSSLRFGTSNTGLTPNQLSLISIPGGGPVALDSNGYLINGPLITITGHPLVAVNTTYGMPSPTPTSFSVSGSNLYAASGNLIVAALSGFEYSISAGGTYTSNLPLAYTGGALSSTEVFVRLAANTSVAGSPYSGNISVSGGGAAPKTIATASSAVSKATPTVSVTVESYTYNGSAQGPTTYNTSPTGDTGTPTWSYEGTGGTTYPASATLPTDAGTYTATVALAADSNFYAAGSGATAFTIAKTTPAVTVTVGSYTYNGSAQGPNAHATNPTGDTGTPTWSYEGTGGTTYPASTTLPTDAGTYTATVALAADNNFVAASSNATAFTIAKATPTVTVTVGSYTYNGSAQGPTTYTTNPTGDTGTPTWSYEGTGGTTYPASSTLPTDAGTYMATVALAADNNFDAASSGATAFTIAYGSAYQAWSGGAAFNDDANGDGVDNGLAWLLGATDKDESALGRLPVVTQNSGNLTLTFRCLKAANRDAAGLNVQYSRDLGITDSWHEAAVPNENGTINNVVFGITDDGNFINVQATIPAGAALPGTGLFGRLNATNAP